MLLLSPQPAMYRDRHPQEGALNLFFDKVKDQTLLRDFDHQIITKSRARVERRRQSEAIHNHDADGLGNNRMAQKRQKKVDTNLNGDWQVHSVPRLQSQDITAVMNQDFLDKALSQADFTNQMTSQTKLSSERIFFNQQGSGLEQLMNITSSSNVVDYKIVTARSPLDPDSRKIVKVQHCKNMKKQRRSVPFAEKDRWQNDLSKTPDPLEMQTVDPEALKSFLHQEYTPSMANRLFLPSIALSPSQQEFSQKFSQSLKESSGQPQYNKFQKFQMLNMDNRLLNNISLKQQQEQQRRARNNTNENFQFQTINKMWPLKPNEPLTIYKHRQSPVNQMLVGQPMIPGMPFELDRIESTHPLEQSEKYNQSTLNGFQPSKLSLGHGGSDLAHMQSTDMILLNAESIMSQNIPNKQIESSGAIKITKFKGKNEMPDQHHVVVPMKLMTGNFNTTINTQQAYLSLNSPKTTFPSFNKYGQGRNLNVSLGRTVGDKVGGSPNHSNKSSENRSPSFNSTSNKSIKKLHQRSGVLGIGGNSIGGIASPNSPRFTPEQQFVLQMPFTNYLSSDMQRTYMQKVRDVQINSKRKDPSGKNLNSLFGHELVEKIVEKTVGEGGTLSQESSSPAHGRGLSQEKTPISFQNVSEMNTTQKREKSSQQDRNEKHSTSFNATKILMSTSEIRGKHQPQLVQTLNKLTQQDSSPDTLKGVNKEDNRNSISIKQFDQSQELSNENDVKNNDTIQSESDHFDGQKNKNDFGNLINENTVSHSGITLHNIVPTMSNHQSQNYQQVENMTTGFESPKSPFQPTIIAQERLVESQAIKPIMPVRNDTTNGTSQATHLVTTVLPNGSTIPCTKFVKKILDKIIESNFESQTGGSPRGKQTPQFPIIRQYLRLAKFVKSDLSLPYTQIALPNERIVNKLDDVLEGNQQLVCLILLKDGQNFTRNHSKLQEIALDSLQQQYIQKKEEQLQKEIQEQKKLLEKISWMQEALIEEEKYDHSHSGDALDSVTRIGDDNQDSDYHKNSRLSHMKLHLKEQIGYIDHAIPLVMDHTPGVMSLNNPEHYGLTPSIAKEGVSVDGVSPQTPIRIPRAENMGNMQQDQNESKTGPSRDNQSMANVSFDQPGSTANFKPLTMKRQSPSDPTNGLTKPQGRQTQGTPYIDTKQMLKLNEDSAKAMMDALRKDSTLNFIQNIDIGIDNEKNISIIKDNREELAGNIINIGHQNQLSKSKLHATSPINFQDQSIAEERFNRFKRQEGEQQEEMSPPGSPSEQSSEESLDPKDSFVPPKASCLNHRAHLTFVKKEMAKLKKETSPHSFQQTSFAILSEGRKQKKPPYQLRITKLNEGTLKDIQKDIDVFLINDSKEENARDYMEHLDQQVSESTIPQSNADLSPKETRKRLEIEGSDGQLNLQNSQRSAAGGVVLNQVPTIRFSSINRATEGSSGNLKTVKKDEENVFIANQKLRSPPSPREPKQIIAAMQGFVKGNEASTYQSLNATRRLRNDSSDIKLHEKSHIPFAFHDQLGISSLGPQTGLADQRGAAINVHMEADPSSDHISGYSPSRATLFKDESQPQIQQQYYAYSKKIQQRPLKDKQQIKGTHQSSLLSLQAHKLFQKVDQQFS